MKEKQKESFIGLLESNFKQLYPNYFDANVNFEDSIYQELQGHEKFIDRQEKKAFEEYYFRFPAEIELFDLIIFQHFLLSLMLTERFNFKSQSFKHIPAESQTYKSLVLYSLLLNNCSNSLISIKNLLSKGLNLQCHQLFRCYIEYADIGIVMLGDETFARIYQESAKSRNKEKKAWANHLKPSEIEKKLIAVYSEMLNETKDSHFYLRLLKAIRKSYYNLSSGYTHGKYNANFQSAFDEQFENTKYVPTIGGRITKTTRNVLDAVTMYSHLFIKHSILLIVKNHDLPFVHFEKDGKWFTKLNMIVEGYVSILKKYHDNFENEID
jgi:hypothetical protein